VRTEQYVAYRPNQPHDFFQGSKCNENTKTEVNKISVFKGVFEIQMQKLGSLGKWLGFRDSLSLNMLSVHP